MGPMQKSLNFRRLLKQKKVVRLAGAHDALSAKLIEEAGFDGVWASSFGISASTKCLPDMNVLTMTEALEAAKGMNEAIGIPLIADCDNGYGNALNVMRMVREYERAGIAGISIEDNPFPKKCSLYPGERQDLVDKDEMAGRIHAAKNAQRTKEFFVIARTEALIAELGMDEALSRAEAYEAAGADAILIHSRQSTPAEIREFARRWKGKVPLVAVPTKYPDVRSAELGKMGIKVAIFANQALRASVTAMRETLKAMHDADKPGAVEKKIVTLKEVFRLVGQPAYEENEQRFVKSFKKMPTAVIVAAGFEENFWPLNSDKPKAMLEIKGKTILERQIEMLKKAGIERIAVVTGYKREKVNLPGIITYNNPRYRNTHILYSLFTAEREMRDKFLFLYGDVLIEEHVIEKLLKAKGDINLVVRRLRRASERLERSQKTERDWVIASDRVTAIGHHIDPKDANGEFAGLASFSKKGAAALCRAYEQRIRRNGHGAFHNAPSIWKAQFTDMMQELIDRKEKVSAVDILSGWVDINSFADYQRAWQAIKA